MTFQWNDISIVENCNSSIPIKIQFQLSIAHILISKYGSVEETHFRGNGKSCCSKIFQQTCDLKATEVESFILAYTDKCAFKWKRK